MIPFAAPLNFTEVNSSGNLNQKAAEKASSADNLAIQYFKLTENVSGNLSLDNNTTHKKIILDTNGFNLTNPNGSPLTTNSSIDLELRGSGNVQSTLLTSTATQESTSHTGTTIFDTSDSSQIVVSGVGTDLTVEKYIDRSGTFAYDGNDIDGQGTITVGGSTPNASTIFGTSSASSTAYGINTTDGSQAARFIGDTAQGASSPIGNGYELYIATIGPNTVSQLRMDEYAKIRKIR